MTTETTDETIHYTADVVLFAAGHVLLIERGWDPYEGCWALPGGHVDAGETSVVAAARELEEETGSRAGSWRYLGAFYTAPGFTSELMHLYLAEDLTAADGERLGPDEDERLELYPIPFEDALALADRGELRDAKSLIGLYRVASLRADRAAR
jgi:8-oxo-dGTP pyrophosphatase MutT (NUDIX family)